MGGGGLLLLALFAVCAWFTVYACCVVCMYNLYIYRGGGLAWLAVCFPWYTMTVPPSCCCVVHVNVYMRDCLFTLLTFAIVFRGYDKVCGGQQYRSVMAWRVLCVFCYGLSVFYWGVGGVCVCWVVCVVCVCFLGWVWFVFWVGCLFCLWYIWQHVLYGFRCCLLCLLRFSLFCVCFATV